MKINSRTTEENDLIDKIDAFLELRINTEFDELREDVMERISTLIAVNDLLMDENSRQAASLQVANEVIECLVADAQHADRLKKLTPSDEEVMAAVKADYDKGIKKMDAQLRALGAK